jgi:hypothetical protein
MELPENEENVEDKRFGLVWNFTGATVTVWKYMKCKVMNQFRINYSIIPNIRRDIFFPLGLFTQKRN